jgi:hypothetical protein
MRVTRLEPNDPDRPIELQEQLDVEINETIAEANAAGCGTEETIEALEEVVASMKIANDMGPDPADDPA